MFVVVRTSNANRKDFVFIVQPFPSNHQAKSRLLCAVLLSHYFYRIFKWRGDVFVFSTFFRSNSKQILLYFIVFTYSISAGLEGDFLYSLLFSE